MKPMLLFLVVWAIGGCASRQVELLYVIHGELTTLPKQRRLESICKKAYPELTIAEPTEKQLIEYFGIHLDRLLVATGVQEQHPFRDVSTLRRVFEKVRLRVRIELWSVRLLRALSRLDPAGPRRMMEMLERSGGDSDLLSRSPGRGVVVFHVGRRKEILRLVDRGAEIGRTIRYFADPDATGRVQYLPILFGRGALLARFSR